MVTYITITIFASFVAMFFSPLGVVRSAIAGIFCMATAIIAAKVRERVETHAATGEIDGAEAAMMIGSVVAMAAFLPKFGYGIFTSLAWMGIGAIVSFLWNGSKKSKTVQTTTIQFEDN